MTRLQIPTQLFGRRFGGLLEVKRRDEAAVFVHEINDGGVVHGVVAVLERNFLGVNPIRLERRVHRSRIAGQSPQMRIEVRQIVAQDCRRVALRIDRYEQGTGAVGILAERLEDF